jgi:hypothetical protein
VTGPGTVLTVILTFAIFAAPLAAHAQPAAKVYRVGTLVPPVFHKSFRFEELRQALRDRGYLEGQNFVLESRFTA